MRRRSLDSGRTAEVEVVLVEDLAGEHATASGAGVPGPGAGSGPPGVGRPPAAPGGRRRHARTVGARAAAIVGALAVLGAVGLLQSREQAVVAETWGGGSPVLGPVHLPPAELWRADGRVAGLGEHHVLVATQDGLLHGIDPRGGDAVWSTVPPAADASSWCTVLHRTPDGVALIRSAAPGAPAVLAVCEHGWWVPTAPGERVRRTSATVVDPATGAVLAERELAGGLLVSDVVDGDLLHAWADRTGRIGAMRWEPWTGRVRWTFRSDDRVTGWRANGVSVRHGARTVTFVGSGTLTVDLVTGAAVDRPRGERVTRAPVDAVPDVRVIARDDGAEVRSDGAEAWARDAGAGTELWRVPLVPVGRLDPLTDGAVVVLPVADGSPHGTLVGMRVRSGDPLWRLPLPQRTTALRAGHGVVLVESREGVTALG
jgi:outer membrane protein assembly factor BamB